jgi:CBS domain containing-hemolysin-like protein
VAIAAGVLLLLSAAVSATEAALFSLGSEQIESFERHGRYGSLSVRALLTFRDETLTTFLLTSYALNLGLVVCLLAIFLRAIPGHPVSAAAIGGLLSAALIVAVGEFLPRALGRCFNVPVSLALARPVVGLTFLMAPFRWLILGLANVLLGLPSESLLQREMGSEEELKTLITASDLKGGIEEDERELINGVVEFGSTRVGEIMTPRPELFACGDDLEQDVMLERMRRAEFSRVLIYTDTLDQVRGVLHVKDLLLNPAKDYREMLRKPLVIPETKGLMDLLREFRRRRLHLAVVCDEFGRTAGVVTMHDLLEEILGELTDENRRQPETIRPLGESVWIVPGRTDIYDLRERLGLELPEELGRTASGFLTNRLGRIPALGDTIEQGGFRLTVERMGVRRVAQLRIERLPAEADGSAEEAPS